MGAFQTAVLVLLSIIEYSSLILFLCTTILYQLILAKRKVFHSNLHFLLQIGPGTYFLFFTPSLTRVILESWNAINQLWSRNLLFLRDSGMFGGAYNLLTLTIERFVASIFVDRYENTCVDFPLLGIAITLVQWAISTSIMYLAYQNLISNQILIVSLLVSVIVSTVTFVSLPKISRRAHERSLSNRGLNRYQVVENVRSAKVLNYYVLFIVFATPGGIALYFLMYYIVTDANEFAFDAIRHLLHTYIAFMGTLSEAIVLYNHPALKEDARRLLRLKKRPATGSKPEPDVIIRSVRGDRLNVAAEEHTTAYFEMYQRSW